MNSTILVPGYRPGRRLAAQLWHAANGNGVSTTPAGQGQTLVGWNPAANGHGTGGGDARDRRNVGRPNSGTESGFGERPL